MTMNISIHTLTPDDLPWVEEIFRHWGADFIVSRGKKWYPNDLDGFYAVDANNNRVGLVTYHINDNQCEIVTLDAFKKYAGIGTALLAKVINTMKATGRVKRLWLITMNDNLDAQRFYYRKGWQLARVHRNAMDISRQIKPSIPEIGAHGIPLRDELEFEYLL